MAADESTLRVSSRNFLTSAMEISVTGTGN
jgi:hypothetical protein